MSTTTAKHGLFKPDLTDPADITQMNQNWDKIDEKLNNIPITSEVPSDAEMWIDPNEVSAEESHLTNMNNPHNVTIEQIGAAPSGYGLGETSWRSAVPNEGGGVGVYSLSEGATDSPFQSIGDIIHIGRTANIATQIGIEHQFGRPDLLIRKRSNVGWGEWRHINPGMKLNTEYLTNEVWQEKDVYATAISFGNLANTGYAGATLGMGVTPISIHGIAYNNEYICDLSSFRDVDEVFYQISNGKIMIHSATEGAADYKAIVVVKYTKN